MRYSSDGGMILCLFQSLFVAGTFHRVNGELCDGIAVWHRYCTSICILD